MNKHIFGRKLSRSRPAREALFASLSRSLIINGKIETTRAKAKAVQGMVEKFVTVAKKGEISGRRRILANLDNATDAVEALYKKVVPALSTRTSGFTRITSLPTRLGDHAKMVRMEWTEKLVESKKPVASSKKTEKTDKKTPEKIVKSKSKSNG